MNPMALRLHTEDGELLPVPIPGKGLVFMKDGEEVAKVTTSTKPGFPFQKTKISLESSVPAELIYYGKKIISTAARPESGVMKKMPPLTAEVVELAFPLSLLPPILVKPYDHFKQDWLPFVE